nr:MAG TPA: hypothetical protein [Caudoviricetes sp.]
MLYFVLILCCKYTIYFNIMQIFSNLFYKKVLLLKYILITR